MSSTTRIPKAEITGLWCLNGWRPFAPCSPRTSSACTLGYVGWRLAFHHHA